MSKCYAPSKGLRTASGSLLAERYTYMFSKWTQLGNGCANLFHSEILGKQFDNPVHFINVYLVFSSMLSALCECLCWLDVKCGCSNGFHHENNGFCLPFKTEQKFYFSPSSSISSCDCGCESFWECGCVCMWREWVAEWAKTLPLCLLCSPRWPGLAHLIPSTVPRGRQDNLCFTRWRNQIQGD